MPGRQISELSSPQVERLTVASAIEGKAGKVPIEVSVRLAYRAYHVPQPYPRNKVRLALFIALPSVTPPNPKSKIELGSITPQWSDKAGPDEPVPNPDPRDTAYSRIIPRWVQDNLTVALPPLWAGRYPLYCEIYERDFQNEWEVRIDNAAGSAPRGELVVVADPSKPHVDNGLPLGMTNLLASVPNPAVTFLETARGRISFTLDRTGYPVLNLRAGVPPGSPTPTVSAFAASVRPIVQEIETSILEIPPSEQLFAPVYRSDLNDRNYTAIELVASAQKRSLNLSLASQSAGTSAIERMEETAVTYDGLIQAITTGLRALRWDPNNLHGYLWVAHFYAIHGDFLVAFDFLLTLIFRLRLAERVLAHPELDPGYRLRRPIVAGLPKEVRPDFWSTLAVTAKQLQIDDWIGLSFPNLAKAYSN